MIAIIDVQITAANPSMPLFPWRAYKNSPSSLRIRNVPKRIGEWNINRVYVNATYPDGVQRASDCVLTGGVYVCTFAGSDTTGVSQNGYTVCADGKDENGNAVTGYILGKGDIVILEADGQLDPGKTLAYVHLLSAESSEPKNGDVWQVNGSWYIYQDGQAWPIGDDSGLIGELSGEISAKADLSSLSGCMRLYPSQPEHPVEGDVWYEPFQRVTWVWHNNEWLDFAASPYYVNHQLTYYERKANMKSDVSSIVTAKAFTDWDYPAEIDGKYYAPDTDWLNEHGEHEKTYYVMNVEYVGEETGWSIEISPYAWWDDPDFGSWQPQGRYQQTIDAPEDTLSLTLAIPEELGGGTLVLHREYVNEIGLAMLSDVPAISETEVVALSGYVDDEYLTRVTFLNNGEFSSQMFDWQGEVSQNMLSDCTLSDITSIKFGRGVSAIADGCFMNASPLKLHEVYFSDSLRSIGVSAFAGNTWLYSVVYGNDDPKPRYNGYMPTDTIQNNGTKLSIGDAAFSNCTQLAYMVLPSLEQITTDGDPFSGCNFTYNSVTNGSFVPANTVGIFFRDFYNKSNIEARLAVKNLTQYKSICHLYIPATLYNIEQSEAAADIKYLGSFAQSDAPFKVSARGANWEISANVMQRVHISADPGASKTKNITIASRPFDSVTYPREVNLVLSVDPGVTFAGTTNKLTSQVDWYAGGTITDFRNEFLSAGVEVWWNFSEYEDGHFMARKLAVR